MRETRTLRAFFRVRQRDTHFYRRRLRDDAQRQPGTESHEERIRDAVVHVDGDVGTIWAPFEFLLDGKIDHCGRDIANVVRIDGWVIAAIEDNARTECGAH
jgi:hypothetical protein